MEPIHQKYKADENTCKHNPKNKQKQSVNWSLKNYFGEEVIYIG